MNLFDFFIWIRFNEALFQYPCLIDLLTVCSGPSDLSIIFICTLVNTWAILQFTKVYFQMSLLQWNIEIQIIGCTYWRKVWNKNRKKSRKSCVLDSNWVVEEDIENWISCGKWLKSKLIWDEKEFGNIELDWQNMTIALGLHFK